jgi:site-specific DNA recombinase
LQVPVDEIVVSGETATVKGSYTALISAIAEKKQGTDQVPSFTGDWRACAHTSREEGDQLQSAYA